MRGRPSTQSRPSSVSPSSTNVVFNTASSPLDTADSPSASSASSKVIWQPILCNGKVYADPVVWTQKSKDQFNNWWYSIELDTDNFRNKLLHEITTEDIVPKEIFHHFLRVDADKYLPVPALSYQCTCPYGPHAVGIMGGYPNPDKLVAEEIGSGGGRGSAKSEHAIAHIFRPDEYGTPLIMDRDYHVLVLRKNVSDLMEFERRVEIIAQQIDPKSSLNRTTHVLNFSSGCFIQFDHLGGSQYENPTDQYQGKEFQTIIIEEAGHLGSFDTYDRLKGCLRTKSPHRVRCRIYLTFNPGGPGHSWLVDYFVKPKIDDGNGGEVEINMCDPANMGRVIKGKDGSTRTFIFSTVEDNPYLMQDGARYKHKLESIKDDALRRQWLQGDFDAFSGAVFTAFRSRRLPGEPDNALHVLPRFTFSDLVDPWSIRHGSFDVGFSHHSCALKAATTRDSRVVIYGEMVEAGKTAYEWGKALGQWWEEELLAGHNVIIWTSVDAFKKIGAMSNSFDDTQVGAMNKGVEDQLGLGRSIIFNPSVPIHTAEDVSKLVSRENRMGRLIFAQTKGMRVFGWELCRDLMRWWDPHYIGNGKFIDKNTIGVGAYDEKVAAKLFSQGKLEQFLAYRERFTKYKPKVLPQLLITDNCKQLITAIPTAVFDTDGTNPADVKKTPTVHDDVLDSFRYCCVGWSRRDVMAPLTVRAEETARTLREKFGSGEIDSDTYARRLNAEMAAAEIEGELASTPFSLDGVFGLGKFDSDQLNERRRILHDVMELRKGGIDVDEFRRINAENLAMEAMDPIRVAESMNPEAAIARRVIDRLRKVW